MNVVLNDNMSIAAVQQLFHNLFPYLRLEFFEKASKSNNANNVKKHINGTIKKIQDYKLSKSINASITITPTMTVSGLENAFSNCYNLEAQVLRKSGNIWLEATITDSWSLEDQNKQGEMITVQISGK